MIAVLSFGLGGIMFVSTCTFLASGLTPYYNVSNNRNVGTPKKAFSFRLACQHILSNLCNDTSWFLSSSNPKTRMSSAMQNTLGMLLQSLYIYFWNMSPAVTTPNDNHMYLYLPNGMKR